MTYDEAMDIFNLIFFDEVEVYHDTKLSLWDAITLEEMCTDDPILHYADFEDGLAICRYRGKTYPVTDEYDNPIHEGDLFTTDEWVRSVDYAVTKIDEMTYNRFENLTPHDVTLVLDDDTQITFPASGYVPRLTFSDEAEATPTTTLYDDDKEPVDVPIVTVGELTGIEPPLSEPVPGVTYIVPRVVAEAARDRTDLVFPGQLVRDDAGRVIGCRTFSRFPPKE